MLPHLPSLLLLLHHPPPISFRPTIPIHNLQRPPPPICHLGRSPSSLHPHPCSPLLLAPTPPPPPPENTSFHHGKFSVWSVAAFDSDSQLLGLVAALSIQQPSAAPDPSTAGVIQSLDLALAAPSSSSTKQKQDSSERDEFYANLGSAIRTLRQELPCLFYRDLSYEIYRDDITFRDPRNIFTGIDSYKLIFWALRFHGRMFFSTICVDVSRIWQPSDRVIIVRWTVRGVPRVPWEAQGIFDGTSEYKLDKNGKIYEHQVYNVGFNYPPKYMTPSVLDLLTSGGCLTTPTPTCFDRIGMSI